MIAVALIEIGTLVMIVAAIIVAVKKNKNGKQ